MTSKQSIRQKVQTCCCRSKCGSHSLHTRKAFKTLKIILTMPLALRTTLDLVLKVCLHMFTLDFLNQVATGLEKDSVYHLAEKKIPSMNGYTMRLKLEQFIFDSFPYAPSTAFFEILREEEFATVKNVNGLILIHRKVRDS